MLISILPTIVLGLYSVRRMMLRKLFIYIALLLVNGIYGQELRVIKELSPKTDDIFARTHPVYVGYGDEKQLCAAIKVALILPEASFMKPPKS